MEDIFNSFVQLMNPEFLIHQGGLLLLLLIIFAENGLFFGFFLPGDSLLFMAGMLCGLPMLDLSVHMLITYIIFTAFSGYCFSYFVGYKFGKWLLTRPDSFFFKRSYLNMASSYFEKRHQRAIVAARFIPVIRTFLPLCLGMIKSKPTSFILYNFIGAFVWTTSLVLSGHFLREVFPEIINYIEWIVLSMIVLTFIPLGRQYIKMRKSPVSHVNKEKLSV